MFAFCKAVRVGISGCFTIWSGCCQETTFSHFDLSIVGFTILSKINNGFVEKNCITFPPLQKDVPSSCCPPSSPTPESPAFASSPTFSASAAERFEPIDNLSGWKVNFLSTIFHQIASKAGLAKRHSFRAKFGARDAPLYVAFSPEAPPGLSAKLMTGVFTQ
ncbi:hypothetical protein PROFUN_11344 [Planoprotostelium fungivorum]|uniref:Uncharacterized protein n=1 Tax=Planoprotostelium fungivorum TaxID=1890364 RepID=A0A2P6NAD8_9EUKA|nr:hypothetical protein PROFUN_11344 [Planoprotostelium fungivorum]